MYQDKTAIINERENCLSQPIVNKLSVDPRQKLCVVSLSLRGRQESIRKCVAEPRIFNMRDRVTNIWEMKKINEQEENQTDRNGCKKPKEKESHWFELSN